MNNRNQFESDLKRFGLLKISAENLESINGEKYKQYIKILYLHKSARITVDFGEYKGQNSLFFVVPDQFFRIDNPGSEAGYLIFYNRDFYCIQIHDKEVACDGLLFNNIHNIPAVTVPNHQESFMTGIFMQIEEEFRLNDVSMEEMIRTYLKQLLIRATRLWKLQHLGKSINEQNSELDFFRKFTLLVDAHYKEKHTVADYADVLAMSPKTITHKFKRLKLPQPNEIIKNRILLEAKRLLVHTSMTAKEIAHGLGYEDPAYFSRQFMIKTGHSPSGFRGKYQS